MASDNRLVLILGGAAAILAAVVIALLLTGRDDGPAEPPPASKGGLQLDVTDPQPVGPDQQLRCFVDGRFVGMATLSDCAQRNGVASQALDVGLDSSGQLTAVPFAPPPELPSLVDDEPVPAEVVQAPPTPTPASGPTQRCLRHAGGEWRDVGELTLNACVQQLYSGRCEQLGGASYGRWGATTLRLVPGRVEQAPDNTNFRTLVQQGRDCSLGEVR
ncbi:hypothetical protein [Brevundimonas sp.]|uniref:hypothetical protein n=1 Tax=Brevundimonas sp. TaxID=1871086 RepID=UPI0025D15595|nr:hypothetical protein [Brevundimonas sp.]